MVLQEPLESTAALSMRSQDLMLHPARPDHARAAAELIVSTDTSLFSFCGGGSLMSWRILAEAEFQAANGIYSYRFGTVLECEESLGGVMIAFPSRLESSLDWSFGNSKSALPEAAWTDLTQRYKAIAPTLFPDLPADSFYIQNIVVSEKFRLQGLGAKLLQAAVSAAKAADCSRIALDVGASNSAVAFYERNDFVTTGVSPSKTAELDSHLRMERTLR